MKFQATQTFDSKADFLAAAAQKKLSATHCKHGHTYSTENTYINPKGARVCKTCRLNDKKKYRAGGGIG
jgi:hypothetical protein